MSSAELVSYASLAVTILAILWNVLFGYGKLNGRVDAMEEDVKEIKTAIIRMDDKFERRFEKIDQRFENMEERFEKMEERFEKIESRLEKITDKLDAIHQDIRHIDTRVTALEQRKP